MEKWVKRKDDRNNMKRTAGKVSKQPNLSCKSSKEKLSVSDVDGSVRDKPVTAVMFVPSSKNSRLVKGVQEAETKIAESVSWRVKVLEQPGTPLLLSFTKKFPIDNGCCRGTECVICSNDGIKCSPKGVVYSATCNECKLNPTLGYMDHTYIGETSRPWRERIREHVSNVNNWRPKSFILDHWMNNHPLDTKTPEFEYKIVGSYADALRRQLCEGLFIIERGGLNKRVEFGQNRLCRMQSTLSSEEQEENTKEVTKQKKLFLEKMENFIVVMRAVTSVPDGGSNHQSCFRYSKRTVEEALLDTGKTFEEEALLDTDTIIQIKDIDRKKIRMDSSTPQHLSWRGNKEKASPDTSPIDKVIMATMELDHGDNGVSDMRRTNVSNELDNTALTPPRILNSSQELKSFADLTRNWTRAANGTSTRYTRRTNSFPDLLALHENSLYKVFTVRVNNSAGVVNRRQRTLSESSGFSQMDLSPWDDAQAFEQFMREHTQVKEKLKTSPQMPDETCDKLRKIFTPPPNARVSSLQLGVGASREILDQQATPGNCGSGKRRICRIKEEGIITTKRFRRNDLQKSPEGSPKLRGKRHKKTGLAVGRKKDNLRQAKINKYFNKFDPGVDLNVVEPRGSGGDDSDDLAQVAPSEES